MPENPGAPPNFFYPESYGGEMGIQGRGLDAQAIQGAVNAAQQYPGIAGVVVLSQPYVLEAPVVVPAGTPVHFWFVDGTMNRQVTPPTFTGASLRPANGFAGSTLLTIGTVGNPLTNPNNTKLINPCLNGLSPNGVAVANLIGLLIQDTQDVVIENPSIANFDRAGVTGVGIKLAGTGVNNATGLDIHQGVISTCGTGLLCDGAGTTDHRLAKVLFHSNTQDFDLGPSGGSSGGGLQMSDCHFVYAGAPAGSFQLRVGSGAGDYNLHGNYFDKNGNNVHVVLGNSKGRFSGNHFLPDAAQAGPLVTLSTASQELNFTDNDCQANSSAMTALFKLLAGAGGAPTSGVYLGNTVYGVHGSLISTLIDKNNAAIPATGTATTYVQGNVAE